MEPLFFIKCFGGRFLCIRRNLTRGLLPPVLHLRSSILKDTKMLNMQFVDEVILGSASKTWHSRTLRTLIFRPPARRRAAVDPPSPAGPAGRLFSMEELVRLIQSQDFESIEASSFDVSALNSVQISAVRMNLLAIYERLSVALDLAEERLDQGTVDIDLILLNLK
jgi:hypothetical protein